MGMKRQCRLTIIDRGKFEVLLGNDVERGSYRGIYWC